MYRNSIVQSSFVLAFVISCFYSFAICIGSDRQDRFLNGRIEKVNSNIMNREMILYIYLPDDYENSDASYPVHYMTDAPGLSNLFYDLLGIHSSVGSVPKGIIIGLSGENRESNMSPNQGAGAYLKYLTEEVIPFVETKYRTQEFKSISGHSLGGGFAVSVFLSRPDIFNACIAGSPAYPLESLLNKIDEEDFFKGATGDRFLYTSIGSVKDIGKSQYDQFGNVLLARLPDNLDYRFQINEGESHFSNAAVSIQNGLLMLYSTGK